MLTEKENFLKIGKAINDLEKEKKYIYIYPHSILLFVIPEKLNAHHEIVQYEQFRILFNHLFQ